MEKELEFSYDLIESAIMMDKLQAQEEKDQFDLFVQDLILNFGYNRETDKIDVKKLYDVYIRNYNK